MPKIKNGENIFKTPALLKEWALELSDACGSLLVSKKPNVSKVDALINKFVIDYNNNMEKLEEE
jgi:hypothetical protein|tara:strand:+ start:40 stop:231 length:192 start_codon:yes stop_codon:yes gene_type:complete